MSNLRFSRMLLDDETLELVLRSFEQIRGARGFTEDEASKVLRWAHEIKFGYICLTLIEKGEIGVDVRNDGEVTLWSIPHLTQH